MVFQPLTANMSLPQGAFQGGLMGGGVDPREGVEIHGKIFSQGTPRRSLGGACFKARHPCMVVLRGGVARTRESKVPLYILESEAPMYVLKSEVPL